VAEAGNGRGLSVAISDPTMAECPACAPPKKKRPGGRWVKQVAGPVGAESSRALGSSGCQPERVRSKNPPVRPAGLKPEGSSPQLLPPPPAPWPPELLWVWAAFPRCCCSALLPAAAASLDGVSRVMTFPVELPVPPPAVALVPCDCAKAVEALRSAAAVRRATFVTARLLGEFDPTRPRALARGPVWKGNRACAAEVPKGECSRLRQSIWPAIVGA